MVAEAFSPLFFGGEEREVPFSNKNNSRTLCFWWRRAKTHVFLAASQRIALFRIALAAKLIIHIANSYCIASDGSEFSAQIVYYLIRRAFRACRQLEDAVHPEDAKERIIGIELFLR